MLEHVEIKNFKAISNCDLEIKPLTIVAGPNSAGKSSLLQAIFLGCLAKDHDNNKLIEEYSNFQTVVNWNNTNQPITINTKEKLSETRSITIQPSQKINIKKAPSRLFEKNLFILKATRSGLHAMEYMPTQDLRFGDEGQYTIGTFYKEKDKPIYKDLIIDEVASETLKAQVAWWLSRITDSQCKINVNKTNSSEFLQVTFNLGEFDNISPNHVGVGNNYLVKVIILCLLAKPNDILIIENPEIHLHPKAQAMLGKFFAHIANADIQIILETHCEHLIDGIRYEIYHNKLCSDKVEVLYKASPDKDFTSIYFNNKAHFCTVNQEVCCFPSGFFDATLKELLEMC